MNRTGQAIAESFGLHVLLAGCVIAIIGLLPSPPPIIRLDFSLLERDAGPAQQEETQQKVEPIMPPVPTPPIGRQPIPVLKPQRKAIANATSAKIRPESVHKPAEASKEAAATPPSQADAASAETTQAQGESQSGSGDASGAGTVEAYRRANFSAIRSAILTNLRYPMIARRQGWSGKVEIAFLVTPEGSIGELRVKMSSGHEVLDEEAVAAIRRSAPFTPPRVAALFIMPVTFEMD